MKKIIILFMLVILLSGCAGKLSQFMIDVNDRVVGPHDKVDEGPVSEQYYEGTKGLTLKINEPNDGEIFPSKSIDEVYFRINLLNEGEADIKFGEVCLKSKLPSEYFDSSNYQLCPCQSFSLYGSEKVEGYEEGEDLDIEFIVKPNLPKTDGDNWELDSTEFKRTKKYGFDLITQYEYETNTIVQACVERYDPYSTTGNCDFGRSSFIGRGIIDESSSAPVQVKKVNQLNAGLNKILIEIQIENEGNGRVIDSLSQCSFTGRDKLQLFLDHAPGKVNCGTDEIELDESGKATVTCLIEEVEGEGRNVRFGIRLNYVYEDKQDIAFYLEEAKS